MSTAPSTPSSQPPPSTLPNPTLHTRKQTPYFLRHLKTLLPTAYQSSESQRLSLAYFALSALDLLGTLHSHTTPHERRDWVDWIYGLQHGGGGFKGFTGADVGRGRAGQADNVWDPANLGATFFALGCLVVLGDGMERVRRVECLRWLRGLQRPRGGFGEAMGKGGGVEGGGDVRFCYLALGVRWFLRRGGEVAGVEDVDLEAVVRYIERCVTYDGGIAEAPGHEAHAGETFCGIAALGLLERLPASSRNSNERIQTACVDDDFVENVTKWLVSRQTLQLYEDGDEEEDEEDEDDDDFEQQGNNKTHNGIAFTPGFQVRGSYPTQTSNTKPASSNPPLIEATPEDLLRAGFNGRPNKVADTCYAWWVIGALGVLGRLHLQNFNAAQRYLLEKAQHQIGGFSKLPGDPPDVMHSYLGLAALAAMKYPGLRSIDARLCMSVSAREHFEQNTALGRGEPGKASETE